MSSLLYYSRCSNRKNTDIIIGYFNHYATKILRLSVFFVLVLFSVNSIDAQHAISLPIMGTRSYEFMDTISRYIKQTDLEEVYRVCDGCYLSDFANKKYIYDIHVLKFDNQSNRYNYSFDINEKQINFSSNGSYHITINAHHNIDYEDGYIFKYKGLTFFSRVILQNFMLKQYSTKNCKPFLFSATGFHWFFDIDRGNVDKAYALYSTSENPRYAYDLKTGKVIPYSEFDAAFNKIKQ